MIPQVGLHVVGKSIASVADLAADAFYDTFALQVVNLPRAQAEHFAKLSNRARDIRIGKLNDRHFNRYRKIETQNLQDADRIVVLVL